MGDGDTPPLLDGAVILDRHGRIVAVGPRADLAARFPQVPIAHHRAVVTPGLVNAHTHLELSALRGRVPGGRGFVPWLQGLLPQRAQVMPETDAEAIESAVGELLRAGTAAVGEISNSLATVDGLGSAPLLVCLFHEVFGVNSERATAAMSAARSAAQGRTWPDNVRYVLAPHTPYSMHPELLQQVLAAARASRRRTTIHLAEHAAERAFMVDDTGPLAAFLRAAGMVRDWPACGLDSVSYLDGLGVLGPDLIAVHVADARPAELARLAERRVPVVLCPRSNLHIEVRLPPLQALLAAGIRPGLGTDSLASCPSLDVLAEAQALAVRFPSIPARTLLAMATGFGADVLGLSSFVGRIAPGLVPGLIAFPHGSAAPSDPERYVLAGRFTGPREVLSFATVTPEFLQ